MFNYLKKKFFNKWRVALEPRPEFLERTRMLYLNAWRESFGPGIQLVRHKFSLAAKVAVSLVVFLFAIEGVAAFADSQNVSYNNPLYPLKRYHEVIRSTIIGVDQKPVLHLELAKRRISEIESLSGKNQPEDVSNLMGDLNQEVDDSLSKIEKQGNASSAILTSYCESLGDLTKSTSTVVQGWLGNSPKFREHLRDRCPKILEDDSGAELEQRSTSSIKIDSNNKLFQGNATGSLLGRQEKENSDSGNKEQNLKENSVNNDSQQSEDNLSGNDSQSSEKGGRAD